MKLHRMSMMALPAQLCSCSLGKYLQGIIGILNVRVCMSGCVQAKIVHGAVR